MSELQIRCLCAEDEHEWRRLWSAYFEYYETTVPEEVYRSSFARMLSADDNEFESLIALSDGKPVGLVHLRQALE